MTTSSGSIGVPRQILDPSGKGICVCKAGGTRYTQAMHPKPRFEELAYHETPLGELSLRRRTMLSLENREVYEIILGDAFLMSSLFTEVEQALARLGLAAAGESFPDSDDLDVVVGGLGLGYTAVEALKDPSVAAVS